ncbi:MAG TPA: DUF86 domain-containing protein [bacterium]|jgi:uncharacterized protein with HEPN domain
MRIQDILDATNKILSHTADLDVGAFAADAWMVDAVLRNLTVIGEAARHVPDEVVSKHPDLPWNEMRDLRNIVVHEYFGVDPTIIWHTIREDLPPLVPQLEALLRDR